MFSCLVVYFFFLVFGKFIFKTAAVAVIAPVVGTVVAIVALDKKISSYPTPRLSKSINYASYVYMFGLLAIVPALVIWKAFFQ